MRSLNIDSNFTPCLYASEIEHEFIKFSGGEVHIKIKDKDISHEKITITNRIKNSDDLMKVLITKDALERLGAVDIQLFIPYLTYARQDRVCANGE